MILFGFVYHPTDVVAVSCLMLLRISSLRRSLSASRYALLPETFSLPFSF